MKTECPAENETSALRGVLFDLDGTLLDVAMEKFIPGYVQGLSAHFRDLVDAESFYRTMVAATFSLLQAREAGDTNEALFLEAVQRSLGISAQTYRRRLRSYCADGLAELAPMIRPLPLARPILETCFSRWDVVVIATNPVFPRPVVEARLAWGGLDDFPFHLVTSYENSRFCKPSPAYFEDVLAQIGLSPGECLMVGNDTEHDLAARHAGIPTYLVDTWLVDRLEGEFQADFRGCHEDLLNFLQKIPASPGALSEN